MRNSCLPDITHYAVIFRNTSLYVVPYRRNTVNPFSPRVICGLGHTVPSFFFRKAPGYVQLYEWQRLVANYHRDERKEERVTHLGYVRLRI